MYKILKNIIEMDDYSVQKLSNQPPESFEWNTVEGTELNVSDCIGGKGKIEVKGNTEQKQLSGKNLLDSSTIEVKTLNGITSSYDKDTQEITFNGTCTKDNTLFEFINTSIVAEKNKTNFCVYYVSGSLSERASFRFYDKNYEKGIVFNLESLSTDKKITKIPQENYTSAHNNFRFNNGSVCNNLKLKIMATNDANTDYESYCGGQASPNPLYPQNIEVVTGNNVIRHVGKNLLDLSNGISNHGITTTLKDDGSVDLKGTTDTEWFNMTVSSGKRTKIRLLPGEYTFSVNEALNFSLRIKAFYKNYPAEYFHITINPGKTSGTFTVPRECDNFYVYAYGLTTGTVIDLNIKLQLEEGSTPTQYEPYRGEDYNLNLGSIELCKIGDYEDIPFKNVAGDENYNVELEVGAWYKKKVIDKKFLDGEMYFVNSGVTNVFYTPVITNYSRINNKPFCDNFKGFNNVDTASSVTIINSVGFNNTYNYNRLYISFNGTIDELKDFLNEKMPTLYYANDNPTYEKITDPTLISQLEALRKAKWFKGVNHWWTETENLEPNLKGTYKQSNNLRLQALEQAVVALGGV